MYDVSNAHSVLENGWANSCKKKEEIHFQNKRETGNAEAVVAVARSVDFEPLEWRTNSSRRWATCLPRVMNVGGILIEKWLFSFLSLFLSSHARTFYFIHFILNFCSSLLFVMFANDCTTGGEHKSVGFL